MNIMKKVFMKQFTLMLYVALIYRTIFMLSIGKSLCFASQFWIPRIQLMFKAEDPRIFAERIAEAYKNRELCEAELRYHLYIDCMPMDGIGELDQSSLRRMLDWALSTPGLCKHARCPIDVYKC